MNEIDEIEEFLDANFEEETSSKKKLRKKKKFLLPNAVRSEFDSAEFFLNKELAELETRMDRPISVDRKSAGVGTNDSVRFILKKNSKPVCLSNPRSSLTLENITHTLII